MYTGGIQKPSTLRYAHPIILLLFFAYLGPKVSPLIAVDWTEIAHLSMLQATLVQKLARTIAVPNVNILGGQFIRIGTSLCSYSIL
jgi:hypothetical protein